MAEELWHLVEAQRDDGQSVMFRIRELVPRPELRMIFVIELPFETTEMSQLPSAVAYRRLKHFEDGWLAPATDALGLVWVGVRIEDGSSFFYLYGNGDPNALIARLAPFDAAIGFYDDADAAWSEYATLRELLDAAKQKPRPAPASEVAEPQRPRAGITSAPPAPPSSRDATPATTTRIQIDTAARAKPSRPARSARPTKRPRPPAKKPRSK